jgi:hypothetical protein
MVGVLPFVTPGDEMVGAAGFNRAAYCSVAQSHI